MRFNSSVLGHAASSAGTPADWEIAHRMFDEEHLIEAGREAGNGLCLSILEGDQIAPARRLLLAEGSRNRDWTGPEGRETEGRVELKGRKEECFAERLDLAGW